MNRKRTPLVATIILSLVVVACAPGEYQAWTYPEGNASGFHHVDSPWVPSMGLSVAFRVPQPALSGCQLVAGDVLGNAVPELVVVGSKSTAIFDLQGRLIRMHELGPVQRELGFLMDMDDDGKADIVLGSRGAPVPDFVIINASGSLLHRHVVADPTRAYRAMVPYFVHNGSIVVGTTPASTKLPRGLISYSVESRRREWEFFLPSISGRIRLANGPWGAEYVVSNRTLHSGEFNRLGTDERVMPGFDRFLYVLTVQSSGEARLVEPVYVDGQPLRGSVEVYLMPEGRRALLVHRDESERGLREPRMLLVADLSTGATSAARRFTNAEIREVRVLPRATEFGVIAVALSVENGCEVVLLDDGLETRHVHHFDTDRISLGPVVVEPETGSARCVLVSAGPELLAASSITSSLATPGHMPTMIAVTSSTDLRIYGVDDGEILCLETPQD